MRYSPSDLTGQKSQSSVQDQNSTSTFVGNVWSGIISSIISLIKAISLGTLLFSGGLAGYAPIGIGIVLLSNIVVRFIVALGSSFPTMVSNPQPQQVAILAIIATAIESQMRNNSTLDEILITTIGAYFITTLLTGGFSLVLGMLKVGKLIRFIPYPVISGFIAGTGLLLLQGAFSTMTGLSLTFTNLTQYFQDDILLRWLPGGVLAILILILTNRVNNSLTLPLISGIAIAIFYLVLQIQSISLDDAINQGLLLGYFPEGKLNTLFSITTLADVNWYVVLNQFTSIGVLMLLTALTVLFSTSALELATETDIDVDRELNINAYASLASALIGGIPGSPSLSTILLVRKLGGHYRWVPLIPVGVFVGVLMTGSSVLPFLPKPIIGAILLYLGLDLLVDRLVKGYLSLPLSDFAIVFSIVLVIGIAGFLPAIGVGLILTIVLFVVQYSQVRVAKHTMSGSDYRSKLVRPPHQTQFLTDEGHQIYILILQGYIFFGTSNQLVEQIKSRIHAVDQSELAFILIDFRLVTGLDSSAVLSFVKLAQIARKHNISIGLSHLSSQIFLMFYKGNFLNTDNDDMCRCFPDLDRGIEWCEDQLLTTITKWRRPRYAPMPLILQKMFSDPNQIAPFMTYLEKVHVSEGDPLFSLGDRPDFLYFIESGQISTFTLLGQGQLIRMQTLKAGTVLGEIDFNTQDPHSTMAIAEQPSVVYRLSSEKFSVMLHKNPDTANVFQKFMVNLLAEQLAQVNTEVKTLLQ